MSFDRWVLFYPGRPADFLVEVRKEDCRPNSDDSSQANFGSKDFAVAPDAQAMFFTL